ncbi:M56 family metallopeptidase [Teredinibacter turnerae]|uniref:M56 family metallopeptidase n=1 Tax=Teredinibacter turnerae TaxID=2426 RepID=UPI0004253DAA|nr:M56 family metallopeptidase [Teredinibacter turnerae]
MNYLALGWMLIVVATATWVLSNVLIVLFSPLLRRASTPRTRGHLWVMASLPWVLPLLVIVTLLFLALAKSQGWIHHHCETHLAHHPHFCLEHLPTFALHLSGSLSGMFIVMCSFCLIVVRSVPIWQLQAKSRTFQRLVQGKSLRNTLDDERPLAFALGGWKPSIFISKGLRELLSPKEMRIVVSHEVAHVRHKDVNKNALFEMLLTLHAFPRLLRSSWNLTSELRADRYVAQKFDALEVADVLLKLRRATTHSPFPTSIHGGQLSERIDALIHDKHSRRSPISIHLIYFFLMVFPCLIVFSHHSLETLLGWLI